MRRKLCSVLLSAFALLLLMGAGSDESATIVAQEESAAVSQALETEVNENQLEMELSNVDQGMLIDGVPASLDIRRTIRNDVTYVSLKHFAQTLDSSAVTTWDFNTKLMTIVTDKMEIRATLGHSYMIANGRYLPCDVRNIDGFVMVPLTSVAKAFDAQVKWDEATRVTYVTSGSGAIMSGDAFYNQDDLFWLSRVIYAESGNQSMKGKIAVGNVVMNRVESPLFPNTILGVLSQRYQFSTYQNGRLAYRTPNESSVVAAKLVLEGVEVEETEGALYFDALKSSWAAKHRTFVAAIGDHKFYK